MKFFLTAVCFSFALHAAAEEKAVTEEAFLGWIGERAIQLETLGLEECRPARAG